MYVVHEQPVKYALYKLERKGKLLWSFIVAFGGHPYIS